MSKYKIGDRFKFEVIGVEKYFGRDVYRIKGFDGVFSENVLDGLKKKKRKKKGGKCNGKCSHVKQR